MRNLKLTVRYDGSDFFGWQRQPGQRTVQEVLEVAIAEITCEKRLRANVSGRTDSGVHAHAQVANVFTASKLSCQTLLKGINAKLPADVCVPQIEEVPQSFCANKDAVRKMYRYAIQNGRVADPFLRKYAWFVRQTLDVDAMRRAGKCLVGRHDFRCFETEWPNRLTSVRTVTHLSVNRFDEAIWIEVEADGFLYNMVRAIAGSLVQVGRGYWPESRIAEVLAAMDRRLAGPTAPPEGLFLMQVSYNSMPQRNCNVAAIQRDATSAANSSVREIVPLSKPPHASIAVPGSKSITNRALVLAALMAQRAARTLEGALRSEDTEVMLACLERLGFEVVPAWQNDSIEFRKNESQNLIPAAEADLFVGNSGTTVRFLTAMLSLGRGSYRLDGVARMRERPIQDLLDALTGQLGMQAASETGNGCPPVRIQSNGHWPGGAMRVRSSVSSQFLSGLLLAAPFAGVEVELHPDGELVSEPYVEMTVRMLRDWMCPVERTESGYRIRPLPADVGGPGRYVIEPDASAASYFWAAAAITGGSVTVSGLTRQSLQGDVRFVDLLERMGSRIEERNDGIAVHGGSLRGIEADMNDISDTAMTLGAVACFAEGPTTIRNVAHIRHKETDRISALATELRKLGAGVEERADGLTIIPGPLRGCAVDTYDDHRMAMSLALIGLKVPGVIVRNPSCVTKTYPGFWSDLARLG